MLSASASTKDNTNTIPKMTLSTAINSSFTCTLPPISDILMDNSNQDCRQRNRSNSVLDIANLLSDSASLSQTPLSPVSTIASASSTCTEHYIPAIKQHASIASTATTSFRNYYSTTHTNYELQYHQHQYIIHSSSSNNGQFCQLKAKRKRASPNQLMVLNRIFSQTYFPSTEVRIELGKKLGMSPRTVQIWFQNKRQALRARGRQQQQQLHTTANTNTSHSAPANRHQYDSRNYYPHHQQRQSRHRHPYANARAPTDAVTEAVIADEIEEVYYHLPPLTSPPRSPTTSTAVVQPHTTSKYSLPPLKLPSPASELRSPTLYNAYPSPNSSVDFPTFR